MNRKINFIACLVVAFSTLLSACTAHIDTGKANGSAFSISQIASSSTSITISWPGNSTLDYTVEVYRDAGLKDLYQKYSLAGYEIANNRFTIPFLDCQNIYYVVVSDSDGKVSTPLTVALEENITRNVIALNFDHLHWGYDYINAACGVRLNSKISLSLPTYNIDALADSYDDCILATKASDEGGLLFSCNESLKKLLGVENWSTTTKASVYIRPGYIKLGNAYSTSSLTSPKFGSIKNEESITVDVSFDACLFSTSNNSTQGEFVVSIIKNGSAFWSKTISLEGSATDHSWKHFTYTVENVTADCQFEISTTANSTQICFDNLKIAKFNKVEKGEIFGYVSDYSSGEGIKGVAISDGFSVVTTDEDGYYTLRPHSDTWYIYYSTPSDCRVLVGSNGLPRFFTLFSNEKDSKGDFKKKEYSFSLRKMPDGPEKKFALFTFGDIQVSNETGHNRFLREAVPAISKYAATMGIPCYGITLGDVVSNSDTKNATSYFEKMRTAMHYKKMGMPVFQVMGNHDANWFDSKNHIKPDEHSSTFEVKAQRGFEVTFGPINYSFNRGDVHIVGMRDIVYRTDTTMTKYHSGFLKEQYDWLCADLNAVPDKQNKIVVLCVHIPLHKDYSSTAFTRKGAYYGYIKETFDLLNQFKKAHIMSGHTHILRNYEPSKDHKKVYDHNIGAVCGAWWASNLCGDGTPNGYGVFIGEEGKDDFSDWYYMGYHNGMDSREYQFRLYRGNAITGTQKLDNKNGKEGYYKFNFTDDVILANVFNSDSGWTMEVYEDGKYSGEMEKITPKTIDVDALVGDGSFNSPYQIKSGTVADYDMFVAGWHLGALDRYSVEEKEAKNGTWNRTYHLYQYKLKNKNAKVEVQAKDRFGRIYKSSTFVDYRNNDMIKKP